jgi:hypothetical protein
MEDKTMAQYRSKLEFDGPQQCQQFQMMAFGICCATCECSDQQCPWHRQEEVQTQPSGVQQQAKEEEASAATAS